jgi:putative thioredoxin
MEQPDIVHVDDSNFDFQVLAYSDHIPVLVFFWAKWDLTSLKIDPVMESLTGEYQGRFRLAKVDIDTNKELAQRYKIHTIPSIKIFYKGLVTNQTEAINTKSQLIDFIKSIFPGPENILVEKAINHLNEGLYSEVEEICVEILDEYPEHSRAKLLLAKSLIWQTEYLEALTILTSFPPSMDYRSAERLLPLTEQLLNESFQSEESVDHLEIVYRRAISLIQSENMEAALDGLLSIIKKDKNFRDNQPQQVILGIFELLGENHPITKEYRPLLANALF